MLTLTFPCSSLRLYCNLYITSFSSKAVLIITVMISRKVTGLMMIKIRMLSC